MERDELATVFYGEGPVPPIWATDCPVRFDAWLAFAQPSAEGITRRVDLILAVNEEHGVRRVLDHFQNLGVLALSQSVAASNFVVAKLTLRDLVVAVLPMTSLAGQVRLAQELGPALRQSIDTPAVVPPAVPGAGWAYAGAPVDPEERRQERGEHLRWFLRLLRTVAEAAMWVHPAAAPVGDASAIVAVAAMLKTAYAPTSLTQLPEAPKNRVIDRRRRYPVVSVTTNRAASSAVTRSRATVKADAAEQLFSVDCSAIGWAVVDSGIDAEHPAFTDWDIGVVPPGQLATRVVRVFDFVNARETLAGDVLDNGLIDWARALPYLEMTMPGVPPAATSRPPLRAYVAPIDAHGTHVAGILGGGWPGREFRGICPTIRLYDFRVLDAAGHGDEFSIVTALQAIRHINEQAGRMAIAGVNLSLSVPHDVATHSCGWTPVCIESDRLVRSGVVVVCAAGNSGFTGALRTLGVGYNAVSIADPGNADSVITVGSTHRSDPHRHGVSYFSGRGPTADGRPKPDLLAPGEDIDGPVPGGGISAMHGTSQAAAHVSGAAAMLIARYRELLGRPERVKSILCATATDLGRERAFQGNGLIDVLRAMQSI